MRDLTDDVAERYGYQKLTGAVVTRVEPSSPATLAGIKRGTLIMEVNRKPVKNTKEFNEAIEKTPKGGLVLLRITDGRYTSFVVLTLPKE